jgi:hypothetical protein
MGQAVVILILIAVLWLAVATATIGACRAAAQGDCNELERPHAAGPRSHGPEGASSRKDERSEAINQSTLRGS